MLISRPGVWIRFAHLTAFVFGLSSAAFAAAPPRTVFYQGRVTNDTGQFLTGQYSMTFRLYDAVTGGNNVWGPESFSNVNVENGVFGVYLGSTSAFSETTFITKNWLEIAISGNTFSPRVEFAAGPYAYNAYYLEGQDSAKFARVAGDTFTGRVVIDTLDARTAQGIRFRDDGGNVALYVKDGGAVGIGTTTIEATSLQISGTYDQMVIVEGDGAADEKRWLFRANSRYFDITAANDGWSSWNEGLKIGRTGDVVDTISFPSGKVTIGGTNDLQGKLTIKATGDHFLVEETDGATDEKKWVHKADARFYEIITANDAWSSWSAAMRLGRRGTNVDTIAFPNGRFGIGTSNPAAKLDVVGTVIIQDSLVVGGTGGDSFVITGSGNVGIGKKDPGQKLVIEGGVNDNEAVNILGGGTGYMFLGFDQNTRKVRVGGWDGSFQNFLIEGKVAIGGDTPGSKLNVRGDVAVEDSFSVGGADGDSLMVTGAGFVGIGTKSPAHKLSLVGNELIQGDAGWDAHAETATLFLGDVNTRVRGVRDTGIIFGLYQVDTVLWLKQTSGYVGIRTNNDPQWGLHVVHGSGNGVMIEEDGSWSSGDTATIFFGDANAYIQNEWNGKFNIAANKDIAFQNAGDSKVVIDMTNGTIQASNIIMSLALRSEASAYVMSNTSGADQSWVESPFMSTDVDPNGQVEARVIIYVSTQNAATTNFQLKAYDKDNTSSYPITSGDSWTWENITGSVWIVYSGWKKWSATNSPYKVALHGWVNANNTKYGHVYAHFRPVTP